MAATGAPFSSQQAAAEARSVHRTIPTSASTQNRCFDARRAITPGRGQDVEVSQMIAEIAARDVEDILRTPSQLEYATTRPFFALEVTPITANATIQSWGLAQLGNRFGPSHQLRSKAQRARPKSAAASESVLRGETT
jgi:hypothetical protein